MCPKLTHGRRVRPRASFEPGYPEARDGAPGGSCAPWAGFRHTRTAGFQGASAASRLKPEFPTASSRAAGETVAPLMMKLSAPPSTPRPRSSNTFTRIRDAVAALPVHSAVLDGEAIVFRSAVPIFEALNAS